MSKISTTVLATAAALLAAPVIAASVTSSRAGEVPCPDVDVTKMFPLPDPKTVTENKGKDGTSEMVVADLIPAMAVRRTISWKDGLMCDKRTPLGDFKLSQDKVCYDVRNGARVVGNNDTLVISLEITHEGSTEPKETREFKFPELSPGRAVEVGQSYYRACTNQGDFAGLQKTFRPSQTPIFANRIEYSPAA
jgi:hypothetical protein